MTTESATEPLTIEKFIQRHGITLTYALAPSSPHWAGGDGAAAHWRYTLKVGSREMSGYFTKGSGLRIWRQSSWSSLQKPKGWSKGKRAQLVWNPTKYDRDAYLAWSEPEPPTVAEVLDCLASDASGADQSFEDWCSDLGYDTDSRSAERTYNAVRQEMYDLRKLLGTADFETLLYSVERM